MKRPVLRYHGGKFRLAAKLIALMPRHRIYVEPFCGAASVLLAKPRCYSEVINDLDGEVVNLFCVLRDRKQATELERVLRLTPFARAEFLETYSPAPDAEAVEKARRLIVRSFMGFGSAACNAAHRTGFRASSDRSGTTPAHDWTHYPDCLPAFTARLQGVTVENRDAVTVIAQHDAHDALLFVDPPYVQSTRVFNRANVAYVHEMSDDDHVALAKALHGARGMVMLCGYESVLYDTIYKGWERVQMVSHADGARRRTECVWFNPAAWAAKAQISMHWGD